MPVPPGLVPAPLLSSRGWARMFLQDRKSFPACPSLKFCTQLSPITIFLQQGFSPMKHLFCLFLMLGLLGFCPQARASYDLAVPESNGLYQLHILEDGEENAYWEADAVGEVDDQALSCVRAGFDYWVRLLAPQAVNTRPVSILLFHDNEENAGAISFPREEFEGLTFLAAALTLEDYEARLQRFLATTDDEDLTGVTPGMFTAAAIEIGSMDWHYGPLTALPENGDETHLTGTMVHELAHALGIGAYASTNESGSPIFDKNTFGLWSEGLHDMHGTQAQAGMEISIGGGEGNDSGKFVLANEGSNSGVYFTGDNVREVLGEGIELSFPESGDDSSFDDTVPGLPVNGAEGGEPELSHIELQNGLMSHQMWRNWSTFMEAELAVLQDLGLKFDRKQLFGHSIYASGSETALREFTNTNGYFARENGSWVEGTPNETPLGIGLHIYGSYNDVTQVADLLTIGEEAVGIRVEGVGNKLTVAEGTRIQADGAGGSALLVSYGKDHTITLKGEAMALGEGGIAARFDFGDNILGNGTEYRGSWMWTAQNVSQGSILSKIDGALVKAFNVSGSLKGSAAAISIAENAFVEEINILSGAELEGDIVSHWDPDNEKLAAGEKGTHYTTLTFGRAVNEDGTPQEGTKDEEGSTTWAGDENFSLDYAGNIDGFKSINMTHVAGRLSLSGSINVHTLENNDFLALTGSDVRLPQVTVADKFVNAADATLETGFDGNGEVNSILAGSASLDGTLVLRPLRDFYASNTAFQLEAPVEINDSSAGASITGTMTVALAQDIVSPTLSFSMPEGSFTSEGTMPSVTVSRDSNAYSQYAQNSAAHATGRALDVIAGKAQGDMQNLLEALDWSAPDGSGIADGLKQLGPGAYDAVARASLAQQNEFNLLILRRLMATMTRRARAAQTLQEGTAAPAGTQVAELDKTGAAGTWQFWATPYGAGSFQGSHNGHSSWKSTGVGLLVGADRHFDSGLDLGFHVALAARRTHVQDSEEAQADTKSAFVGLQALLAPDSWNGFYLTGQGRIGIESGEMDRDIHINGYNRQSESRWSGVAGSLQAGFGWDAHLDTEAGFVTMGPLAFFEYAFLHRPSLEEHEGGAARLDVDDTLYDSLLMNLGAHAGWQTDLANGTTLGLDVLAAWRHELLDATFATQAAFRGYEAQGFASDSGLPGRDSLLVQAGLTLTSSRDFTAQLEVGGEFFREAYTGMNIGLNLAWEF